jgi:predicted Rossmann fold nucleotide-binding protein DprA/Smf involved in DNA uptake
MDALLQSQALHMKVAVIGSRHFTNYNLLVSTLSPLTITQILNGGAGAIAEQSAWFAATRKLPCLSFPPDVAQFGRKAKQMRNRQLVEAADEVVAFWDGESKGTAYTINYARECGKRVTIIRI